MTLFSAGAAAVSERQDLTILSLQPWPPRAAPAYLSVEIEYPFAFERPDISLRVNGRPTVFHQSGGGFGNGRLFGGFVFAAGEPGRKTVEIILTKGGKTLSATREVDFQSTGDAVFLDVAEGEALLSAPGVSLLVYFLREVSVKLNGKEVAAAAAPLTGFPGHALLKVREGWQPGPNLLECSGKGANGREVSKKLSLYWAKDNRVRVGEAFFLFVGHPGSKSGPFYRTRVVGPALEWIPGREQEYHFLQDGKWLSMGTKILQGVKALAPGEGAVEIAVKRHFRGAYELDRRIVFQVAP